MHSHEHTHEHEHAHREPEASGQLKFAIGLLIITFLAEVAGGLYSKSLALLADSGHVFMDLFALAISLLAVQLAKRPPSFVRTYGWHRAEILAALVNASLLLLLSLGLLREAARRLSTPEDVLSLPMLVIAVLGLIVNVIIAFRLHGHHGHDLNIKSAYLHVLGDAGASMAVILGAILIASTGWNIVDPLVSIGIGVLILIGSLRLLSKAGHVLLESVPAGISLKEVAQAIQDNDSVLDVHDLHIWTVCSHILSLSCHIHIPPGTPEHHDQVVSELEKMLWQRFCIYHTTLQVEYEHCGATIVDQDMRHHTEG